MPETAMSEHVETPAVEETPAAEETPQVETPAVETPPALSYDLGEGSIETIPEKFRTTADDGSHTINVGSLTKSYEELEKMRGSRDLEPPPEEGYALNVEGLEIEGYDEATTKEFVEGLGDDPMVQIFFESAKESGLSQAAVDRNIHNYIKRMAADAKVTVQRELETFGGGEGEAAFKSGQEKIQRISQFYTAHLSKEQYEALREVAVTAPVMEALDALRTKFLKPGSVSVGGGLNTGVADEARLVELRNKPAYFNQSDPEHDAVTKEVDAISKRLYPGTQAAG